MFCECVGWHSYEKNHNSIMFVWGLFCILRIALKLDRKYAVRLISKTAISSSGRADDNQDCCMVRVRGLDGGPTFQNSSESDPLIIIPAKWNIAIVWLFRTGQTYEKAHTGESGWNGKLKTQVNLSEIRTTHYGGYHRRWLGFGKSGWLRRE